MDAFLDDIRITLNSSADFLKHNQRQAAAPTVTPPAADLSFDKTRMSLIEHPFVTKGGIKADKIYLVLLAILAPNETEDPPKAMPPTFDPKHHTVACERCNTQGFFDRKYGSGAYTCALCGHANYTDLHHGDPTWPGGDCNRIHWEVLQSDSKDYEHTAAIERIGSLINASRDIKVRARAVLSSYRKRHHISSLDVAASAALIVATNPLLAQTQVIEIPRPPPAPFQCGTCNSRWSRKVDARVCCRNGNNYRASKVRRIHFSMQGPPPSDFVLSVYGDSIQGTQH